MKMVPSVISALSTDVAIYSSVRSVDYVFASDARGTDSGDIAIITR